MLFSIELINIIQYLQYEDIRNLINTCKNAVKIFEKSFYLNFVRNKSKYYYLHDPIKYKNQKPKIGDRVYSCEIHPKDSRFIVKTTGYCPIFFTTCKKCMNIEIDSYRSISQDFSTVKFAYSYRRFYRIY